MAEPTERPGSGAAPAEALVYQPISLQAIASLGIAAVYGVVVLVGFVAATLFGSPWLMSAWTLIFPLISLGLALIARSRIRRSEGTLAGTALANWGITLSVIFGLIFISYTAATYFVLRHQAETFTRQWFDRLKEGKVEEAFALTLPLENRPKSGPNQRGEIEGRFNTPGEATRKGPFGQFQQRDEVRYLLQSGAQADIHLLGIGDWDYYQGGYLVQQKYRVDTPELTLELVVPVHGMTSPQNRFQGRQWRIMEGVAIRKLEPTDRGKKLLPLLGQAQEFGNGWIDLLRSGRMEGAYLSTREAAERGGLLKTFGQRAPRLAASVLALPAAGGWPALAGDLAGLAARRELCLPGYQKSFAESLLGKATDRFWPADLQAPVFERVRQLLQDPGEGLGRALEREAVRVLPWKQEGDRLQVRQDVVITLPGEYLVDGVLVLECPAKAIETGGPAEWRVAGLELLRARSLAEQPGRGPPKQGP